MELKKRIENLSEKFFPEVLEIRKHLHQNPELSFQEYRTSEFIAKELSAIGIQYKQGYVKTGIVATLQCNNPDAFCIALRADMDALPIKEKNKVPYRSLNSGVMHACGHDVHMSVLLGCIKILNELKGELSGTYLFIFQPGEEKLPGGAKLMLNEGVFDEKNPDAIIGLHVLPSMESGHVGFRSGMYMASTDEIYITVKGKGGHAAMPHDVRDPIIMASQIVIALQQLVSRKANPLLPTVLSIGKFIANGATNIIPDEVYLEGTFRTFDEKWRDNAQAEIKQIAMSIAEGMGGSCDFKILNGYPVLVNDPELTGLAREFAGHYLGPNKVEELDIRMTAEDFAYFTHQYPSVFYRLGVMNAEKNINSQLHTATFDADDEALKTGMGTMAFIAASILQKKTT